MNTKEWEFTEEILDIPELYPVAPETTKKWQKVFAGTMLAVDIEARQKKREIYGRIASCYEDTIKPEFSENCVRKGLQLIDEIDEWVLQSLVSTRGMYKDCVTKCEKQIFDAARTHHGKMNDEFEQTLRKNVVMCTTDCTEAMCQEFSVSRRSSRSCILKRFQDLDYKIAQVDPEQHPKGEWRTAAINNFHTKQGQGQVFPNDEPYNEDNILYNDMWLGVRTK